MTTLLLTVRVSPMVAVVWQDENGLKRKAPSTACNSIAGRSLTAKGYHKVSGAFELTCTNHCFQLKTKTKNKRKKTQQETEGVYVDFRIFKTVLTTEIPCFDSSTCPKNVLWRSQATVACYLPVATAARLWGPRSPCFRDFPRIASSPLCHPSPLNLPALLSRVGKSSHTSSNYISVHK